MSVQRRVNWISQQRVDVADLRAIESAGANDFDQLFQGFVTDTTQGYIVRGFNILMAGAIGGAASSLTMIADPGALLHINASQSGTVLKVPAGTANQILNAAINSNVNGAFTPNAVNYVTVDYIRFLDDGTSAQVYLWDPTSNSETTINAPRAQILTFVINISTVTPTANLLPIATVITDSGNNVVAVQDDRWLLCRLGTGGVSPNPFYTYPWSQGRAENPSISNSDSVDPFSGGDKNIGSLKEWMNAMMSVLKEVKGTTYWYSTGAGGSIEKLREDLGNTVTTGQGVVSHSQTVAGQINWDDDIFFKIIGSNLHWKLTANPTSGNITLADNEVAYIVLQRDVTITPNLFYFYNSGPDTTTVTSIGAVSWTAPLAAGDFLRSAGDTDQFYTEILSKDSATQVTLSGNYVPSGQTAGGLQSVYALGTYNSVASPSGPRDIYVANRNEVAVGQNTFWLFMRQDNGGSVHRVYVKFLGAELEQGESTEIDSGVPVQLLQYIGSPMASASKPAYVSALYPNSVPEITTFTFGTAAQTPQSSYFKLNSSGNIRKYYVWFNKDAGGTDPAPANTPNGIQVAITTGMTNAQVAAAVTTALNTGLAFDDFTAEQQSIPNANQVVVTNNSAGTSTAAVDGNVGSPFAIVVTQAGTGLGNNFINDGDSLTLAIKKLDIAIGGFIAAIDDPSYDETIDIVASGATPPTSLTGPISSGTVITLPNNSRMGNVQQKYTVGFAYLQIYLNGQYLRLGVDWSEIGASESLSSTFTILRGLVVGDVLELRMTGIGGGGTGTGPAGPAGPAGTPGADAAGGPIAISTKIANYNVLITDNFLLANCSVNSADVTLTLPAAATAVGHIFYFKKIDNSAFFLRVQASGAELIDGLNQQATSVQYESFSLVTDGSSWFIF